MLYFPLPAGNSDQRLATLLYPHLREKGVHILEGFPCFLTTAHSEEDLAAVLRAFDESLAEMRDVGLLGEPPASTPEEVPLTEPQKEVWLASQLGEDASCAFNESLTLALEGPLDADALVPALAELVARHDALGWVTSARFVAVFVVVAALTLVASAISYYGLERPALRLKDRIPDRSRPRSRRREVTRKA